MKNLAKVVALVLVIAMFAVVLTACAPKDVESAKEKMDEAGYLCVGYEDASDDEGVVGAFMCTKITENLVAILYESKSAAKEAFGEYENKTNVKVTGKWIVFGSEAAIAAFEK